MKLAAKHNEAATWKNPNDLAICSPGGYYAKYEQAGMAHSSVSVAISESTRREFEQWYRPPEDWYCETVLYGVDHKVFRPMNHDHEEEQLRTRRSASPTMPPMKRRCAADLIRRRRSCWPWALVARKGHRTLLRSMPSILKQHPGARLVIIGRGHMRKTLMRQAKRLGIAHAVHIQPGMSFEQLALHFRAADVVVYPSYYEGQGLIPLEALASGTPVVYRGPAAVDRNDRRNGGRLFACGDHEDLARAVNHCLDHPDERTEQMRRGRQRALTASRTSTTLRPTNASILRCLTSDHAVP